MDLVAGDLPTVIYHVKLICLPHKKKKKKQSKTMLFGESVHLKLLL